MATILIPKPELLYLISDAVRESGWNLLFIDERHPFKIKIFKDDESYFVRIIIYNITHGGGYQRAANEYRIQWHFRAPLPAIPGYKTLILGYYEPLGVFAGWDVSKHPAPKYSSSFQIRVENLTQASISGFSPCDKGNGEIAIAFKPDFFAEYVRNLESLHTFGESPGDFAILENVTANEILVNDALINQVSQQRQKTLKMVSETQRDRGFNSRVLRAYGYRCAFSGTQLKLIDAAHVVPVNAEGSTDETRNGIALSPNYHRAYDRGLITFGTDYRSIVKETEIQRLQHLNLSGGVENFLSQLREVINVPPEIRDRPHTQYVERANQLRGWHL